MNLSSQRRRILNLPFNRHNIVAEIDPDNAGVLIVYLGGHRQSTGREVDPDEITRRLAEDEKSCTIM